MGSQRGKASLMFSKGEAHQGVRGSVGERQTNKEAIEGLLGEKKLYKGSSGKFILMRR